jgi:hypothetical protein
MGVALGRAVTDTGYAVKDAAEGGAAGFAGRLKDNMKDAVMSAGTEGAAAFREGADSRINNLKAAAAVRSGLQGAPAAAGTAAAATMTMSAGANPVGSAEPSLQESEPQADAEQVVSASSAAPADAREIDAPPRPHES